MWKFGWMEMCKSMTVERVTKHNFAEQLQPSLPEGIMVLYMRWDIIYERQSPASLLDPFFEYVYLVWRLPPYSLRRFLSSATLRTLSHPSTNQAKWRESDPSRWQKGLETIFLKWLSIGIFVFDPFWPTLFLAQGFFWPPTTIKERCHCCWAPQIC